MIHLLTTQNLLESYKISLTILPNELLYQEGLEVGGIFQIKNGQVATFKSYQSSKVLIGLYQKNQIVGFSNLKSDVALHSALALSHTEVDFFQKATIEDLMQNNFDFNLYLLQYFCKEVNEIEQKRTILLNKNAKQHIAYLLLELHKQNMFVQKKQINLPTTHEVFADLMGISMSRFSKILIDFETKGWIESHKSYIKIRQITALENLLGINL